jgi:hypothetical protein
VVVVVAVFLAVAVVLAVTVNLLVSLWRSELLTPLRLAAAVLVLQPQDQGITPAQTEATPFFLPTLQLAAAAVVLMPQLLTVKWVAAVLVVLVAGLAQEPT